MTLFARTFNGTPGEPSIDQGGPDQLEQDLDAIALALNPGLPGGGIGPENMKAGASTDAVLGTRTVDPAIAAPAANTGTLTQLLSWVVKALAGIIGADWKSTPPTSLTALHGDTYRKGEMDTALALKANLASPTFTGTVGGITKAMVGLGNVDNTADAAKNVLTATKLSTPRKIGDANFDGSADITMAAMGGYTRAQLQTAGQSAVSFHNLTDVPNLADGSWKTAVANRAALPLTGNTVGDQRVVLNDGDGKQAVYACIATTGEVDAQWAKAGDVDWMTEEATRVAQENARVTAEGGRVTAEGGRVTVEGNRVAAENARVTAEGNRVTAENARVTAEGNRVTAENARVTAEGNRVTAENARVTAEGNRVTAENARVARETAAQFWDAYDPGRAYVPLNKVSYNGSSYVNINACTGVAPTVTANWLLIAARGADGMGSGDMLKTTYDTDDDGVVDASEVAYKLAVARKINGVDFDGTADIELPNQPGVIIHAGTNTSANDTYVATIPGVASYTDGLMLLFKATVANTAACTLNINGLGAKGIRRYINGTLADLATGDILVNTLNLLIYNATSGYFTLVNDSSAVVEPATTQTLTNKTLTAPRITSGSFIADPNGNELIKFPTTVASAVNEITVSNTATGGKPSIAATGGDTNITLNLVPKGTGTVQANGVDVTTTTGTQTLTNKTLTSPTLTAPRMPSAGAITDANGNELILFPATVGSAVNEITVSNAAAGDTPTIAATGGDANINLTVNPKGTGVVRTTVAQSTDTSCFRNITLSTSAPSGGIDGDVWIQF